MFDFLNERKANVIWRHRVLMKLDKFPGDYVLFLENLEKFERDLCSPISADGSRKRPDEIFTEEDIKQIKKYMHALLYGGLEKLHALAQKILQQAGFELWHHAGGRPDYNDWMNSPEFYTRGIHNLREHFYRSILENPGISQQQFVIPSSDVLLEPCSENFRVKINLPHHSRVEQITLKREYSNRGFFNTDPFRHVYGEESTSPRINYHAIYPFYSRCTIFCVNRRYTTQRVQVGTQRRKVKMPIKFLGLGRAGLKRSEETDTPIFNDKKILTGGEILPLNQITTTNETEPAYLLQLFLPKIVPDSAPGRGRVALYPTVNIVASKRLIEETASFLLEYPDLYIDLARFIFPAKMFPNIAKGIINAPSVASRGMIFDNFTDYSRTTID